MNRMLKSFALVLLALLCVAGVAIAGGGGEKGEGGGQEKITIAYTGYPGGLSAFWAQMAQYMAEEAEALGVEFLDMSPTEANAAMQKDAVDTAIDHPHISALAQTDNLASARILGQYIVDTTEKGKVIILGGTLGHQTGDARRDGVRQVLEANGYTVIFRACNWDPATALETATNELAANPDAVAVFGCWDPGALAGLSAVKQRGLLGKVKVYGFDGLPDALKSIKNGELTATVKQDNKQMAQTTMRALVAQINGQESVKKLLIDGFVIDASNVDQNM